MPALDRIGKALSEWNWRAERRLAARCGRRGRFRCRGRIQLHLDPGAVVTAPPNVCQVGVPLYGNAFAFDRSTVLDVGRGGVLELDGAVVGRGAALSVGPGARLAIGPGSYVADGSRILAGAGVSIGRDCAIAFGVTVIDDDGHGFGPPPYSAPIVVGDRVWIGCNVTVLKGVTLGDGSVVAAGAVVTRSCPPGSLLAGVPARVVREGVRWTDAARRNETP